MHVWPRVALPARIHTECCFSRINTIKCAEWWHDILSYLSRLTKQGSLKDKTDCSPSNGYYFLPLYDKGEYVLKIAPPAGWSFENEQFEINFDGKTDLCSLGKDVNFEFKGFGITGFIAVSGQKNGAKDVNVELRAVDGSDIRRTVSDATGVFSFTPVIPGKYAISVSRDR